MSEMSRVDKVRVMIVPGHEPGYGGTEFKDLKERDLVVDLAEQLKSFLEKDSHYEAILARDKSSWNADLQNYFNSNWDGIVAFVRESKSEMIYSITNGSVARTFNGIEHNDAPTNVALRLYGINKWANENKIDIVVHIHFNDYPRKNRSVAGEHSGFAIYIPESQYSNSPTTRTIAEAISKKLTKYNAISDLPNEESGVVEDQELIAVGSYNTLNAPSILIEYGYIYEPQFTDLSIRDSVIKDLAFQTYLGIEDFFGEEVSKTDTLILPYVWTGNHSSKENILALQTALIIEGLYPPTGKTKNDCPRTGIFGPCTIKSLNVFQDKYKILNEKETVGSQTQKVLNDLYSVKIK